MGSRESFICHIILKDGLKIHAYRNTFVYLYTLIIKAKEFLVGPSVFAPIFRPNYMGCHRQVLLKGYPLGVFSFSG
jgi:hypothetical protein